MVAIPGYVFIVIGVMFAAVSTYVNRSQNITHLTIFVYIGYGFIAYGLAKLVVKYIMKQKGKQSPDAVKPIPSAQNTSTGTAQHHAARHPPPVSSSHTQQQAHSHPQQQQHSTHHQHHKAHVPPGYVGVCSGCGTPMRAVNLYCHRCGMRQHTS